MCSLHCVLLSFYCIVCILYCVIFSLYLSVFCMHTNSKGTAVALGEWQKATSVLPLSAMSHKGWCYKASLGPKAIVNLSEIPLSYITVESKTEFY